MPRPKSPARVKKGKSESKETLEKRSSIEESLKGNCDIIDIVPRGLCKDGALYYKFIINELKDLEILSNIDVPTLKITADCLAKIDQLEEIIQEDGLMVEVPDRSSGMMILKEHPAIKTRMSYITQFRSFALQLGMSPSARASLAGLKMEAKMQDEDPVAKALRGEY